MLQIINYSEKAVAVIGDTKEIKEQLKAMGGKFNPRLSCGAGWIFSAKKRAEIEKVLKDAEDGTTPETAKKTAVTLPAPRVYCGTYGKYNRGSIAGAWVTITDFKSGAEVVKYCCNLHKDERDPELMFQDKENFPDQFYRESMNAKDFDNVLQWYAEESTKKPEKIRAKGFTDCKADFIAGLSEEWEKQLYNKDLFAVVRIADGFAKVEKSRIQSRFWEPEGMIQPMEDALRRCEAYYKKEGWLNANLHHVEKFEEQKKSGTWYRSEQPNQNGLYEIIVDKDNWTLELYNRNRAEYCMPPVVPLTEEEKKTYFAACDAEHDNFKKRLETWWKRYGADHVHADTYWADR